MGRLLDEDMVINALQTTKFRNDLFVDRGYARAISIIKELPTIQPEEAQLSKEGATSDLISRQAAIDALDKRFDNIPMEQTAEILMLRKDLRELPPAQPEPHEGHWIPHESPDGDEQYECSRCGVLWEFNDGTPEDNEAYFCPKCGKKLITK